MKPLPRSFYERNPAIVAKELLGKVLIHRSRKGTTSGAIVETEAYFGKGDPASRASRKRTKLNEIMWGRGGLAFMYMIHARWMFNVTAEREGIPGAALIRALEPIEGVELMKQRRKSNEELTLTSGPGRLTQALGLTYEHHGLDLTDANGKLLVIRRKTEPFEIARSHRIGVSADLRQRLRFYIKGNPHVSR
jgi:DNA-3-methyladenine glycosylase